MSEVTQAYDEAGQTFTWMLVPEVNGATECDPAGMPFTETIFLDGLGLPAGTYTVISHAAETSLTCAVDNVAP